MRYTKWHAYCLGSEGYQVRRDNEGVPASKVKEELKERLTPIVYSMGGSFETQKANAHLIAAAPDMYEACKAAQKYDMSIAGRAARGEVSLLDQGAMAEGNDLDTLYLDWQSKVQKALAKAGGN